MAICEYGQQRLAKKVDNKIMADLVPVMVGVRKPDGTTLITTPAKTGIRKPRHIDCD